MRFSRFLAPARGAVLLGLLVTACGDDAAPDDGTASTSSTSSATTSSVAASSTSAGVGGGDPELPVACKETSRYLTSDGIEVTRCDALYPTRPYVVLPESTKDGEVTTFYGALDPQLGLVLPSGDALVLLDDAGEPHPVLDAAAPWAAALGLPSARVLVYVYEVRGIASEVTIDGSLHPALRYVDARPVVFLPGEILDGALLGAWEGRIAGRLPVPMGIFQYGLDAGAPIRVEYTSLVPAAEGLTEWNVAGQSFPEGARSVVIGQIVNMTSGVRGADGSCIEALSANPDIPFADATDGRLDLQRLAAMHAPGDMVLAHDYPTGSRWAAGGGMSNIGPAHPAALIQDAARPAWTDYAPCPHGTPDGMQVDIHKVDGGGGPCP